LSAEYEKYCFGRLSRRNAQRPLLGRDEIMSLGTILLVVLVIALLGGFSGIGGGRFYGTGYYGGGGLGLILIIVLILVLLGRI
jgi:poly(3-hydroxybutyrate) depolymerase